MNTRKVHPLIEELIIAASNNNVPQMKNIIQAIPVFQEIRNLESHAYNKLDLKNCISDEININCANKDNNPALVVAAKKGHMEVVDELLSVEADPNVKDSAGSTALIYSAIYGHEKLVKRLISAQADLNIQNEYNDTALAEAAFNDHLSVVKLLVEAKADLNTPCNEGKTALMWAIMKKNMCLPGKD